MMRRPQRLAAFLSVVLVGSGALAAQQADVPDAARIAIGRQLFFDTRLSGDGRLSCATCHDPARGFTDGRPLAIGIGGAAGTRNTPSIVNTGFQQTWFWDGRASTLEEQVLGPIANPVEMGLPLDEMERRLGRSKADVAASLAAYLRTVRTTGSAYARDRPQRPTLSADEQAGFTVFTGRGGCTRCHGSERLTDNRFHNTGVAWNGTRMVDPGRYTVTRADRDYGAFKTPALMDIALTAPYMHDGSMASLEAVVEFYDAGGRDNVYLDSSMRPLFLTAEEKRQLVAFMRALTGSVTEGSAVVERP